MHKKFYHTTWNEDITRVDWDLGNACNLNCSYCPPNTKQGNFTNPDIDTLKTFAESMLTHYDGLGKQVSVVFGTSGEPTAIEHFPALLKFLHNRVREISVQTNFTASKDWWAEHGYLIHNVHGTVHYQGDINLKSLYPIIMQVAQTSKNLSIVVAMLPERFQEQLDDMAWFEKESGINIGMQPLLKNLYHGGAWIDYTADQKKEFEKRHQFQSHTIETHDSNKTVVAIEPKMSFDVVLSENDNERCFNGWKCYAGIDTLVIDSRGYVRNGWCAQLAMGQEHMTKWNWINKPFTCNMAWCRMHHDLLARKELD